MNMLETKKWIVLFNLLAYKYCKEGGSKQNLILLRDFYIVSCIYIRSID